MLEIGAGSALFLEQSVLQQGAISFLGVGGELGLDQFVNVAAPIEGFGVGDSIVAAYVDHVSWDQASGILTLLTGSEVDGTLALTGDFSHDVFKVHEVGEFGDDNGAGGAYCLKRAAARLLVRCGLLRCCAIA